MATRSTAPPVRMAAPDHRVQVAARKRAQMRARLLEATLRSFANATGHTPVIDDVVKQAQVSRGAFYLHFRSIEEAVQALSQAQSDQMTQGARSVYDLLKEPWQRFAVGYRIFMMRAQADPFWASFVTRSLVASDQLLVTSLMREDLRRGLELEQFAFGDPRVALDFMMSASVAAIRALGQGVADPEQYMDESLRMAMAALGCSRTVREKGVKFSRTYLAGWRMKAPGDAGTAFD